MNKRLLLLTILSIAFAFALAISASAAIMMDDEINLTLGPCVIQGLEKEIPVPSSGFTFELDEQTMTAKIISWTGANSSDILVIPSSVTYNGSNYTVTEFSKIIENSPKGEQITNNGNYCLKTVFIPDTIIAIPDGAFAYARALEYFYVGSGIKMVGSSAFYEAGFTSGGYKVNDGFGTMVSIEETGANIGEIKEFIWKSKQIEVISAQAFYNMEFDMNSVVELDLSSVKSFGSNSIAMNQYHAQSGHYYNGIGLVLPELDIRNATSIASTAFSRTYGVRHLILNADQIHYFSSHFSYKKVDTIYEIYGGDASKNAVTLSHRLFSESLEDYGDATINRTYIFHGYINACTNQIDGVEYSDSASHVEINYCFANIETLNYYINSVKSTANGAITLSRYADYDKGYFVVCDNTNGHNATDYKAIYNGGELVLDVISSNQGETPAYLSLSTNVSCISDATDYYNCYVCENVAKVEITEERLGHNYDLENGASISTIVYVSFDMYGEMYIKCSRCDEIDVSRKAEPIFTVIGYSYKLSSTNGGGLACGYSANKEALNAYAKATKQDVKFGLIMFNAESEMAINATQIFVDDKLAINGKSIQIEITTTSYSFVNIMIYGFDEKKADIPLVIALYINEKKTTEYGVIYKTSFIQGVKTADGKSVVKGMYERVDGSLITLSYNSVVK